MEELSQHFSLERVGKSGARFDPEKTKWFNHQYLVSKPDSELAQILLPILVSQGAKADVALAERVCAMVKERCHFVAEIWDQSFFLFKAPESYDEKVVAKRWKEDVPAIMGEIANFFETVEVWSAAGIKVPFSAFVSDKGWNFGTVMNALRLSLVGGSFGPDFFEICEIVGKAETVGRIRKAVATIKV